MKYILILTLFFCSCNNDTVTITREEYKQLKGLEYPKHFTVNNETYDVYLGSDKHEYYKVRSYNATNYFHYIDCKYCKKDTL